VSNTYKIRRLSKPGKEGESTYDACSIALPMDIARLLPEDMRFSVELTDEGVLYRPVHGTVDTLEIPDWVQEISGKSEGNGSNAKRKPKRAPEAVAAS
jgi:hypothetical protein